MQNKFGPLMLLLAAACGSSDARTSVPPTTDERPAECAPPGAAVIGAIDEEALVIASVGNSPAAARTVEMAIARQAGPVVLAEVTAEPPVRIAASANLAGTGVNKTYQDANAALQRRCFRFDAYHELTSMPTDAQADIFAALPSALAAGHDAGSEVTVVLVGFGRHLGSGVDMNTADLGSPETRQRFVTEHVNAGLLTPLRPGERLIILSPGEQTTGIRGAQLAATADLVCEVLDPDLSGDCQVAEDVDW